MYFISTLDSINETNACTAGLPIRWTVGRRHKFCRRGQILIPRPVLESPAQTTRVCKSVRQPRGTCHNGFLKSDPAEVLPGHCINLTSLLPAMSYET